ncbi:WD40-repeat-containing domain protein [Boletus reticuloceps]|uniref:WD40-repeat-containing domain protein n=1 Tax=Boletus reticuloceps TaxID=495285 RepID=A0A8I2YDZ4_9AGAM|nr:WD40-repeat-containing domain protein [Boletus reticuloceps]
MHNSLYCPEILPQEVLVHRKTYPLRNQSAHPPPLSTEPTSDKPTTVHGSDLQGAESGDPNDSTTIVNSKLTEKSFDTQVMDGVVESHDRPPASANNPPFRRERRLRNSQHITGRYASIAKGPLLTPPHCPHPQSGDLFVHKYGEGGNAKMQVWLWSNDSWLGDIVDGHIHPCLSDYRLNIRDSSDPTWVTRKTRATYRIREQSHIYFNCVETFICHKESRHLSSSFTNSMKFRPYKHTHTLRGHTAPLSCIAFSLSGSLLASGADDGNLIVWDPHKGQLLHRIAAKSEVTCLAWYPTLSRSRLLVGCADGTIALLERFEMQEFNNAVLTGVNGPVYALAFEDFSSDLAVAVGSEVHIAKEITPTKYATYKILPSPQVLPHMPQDTDQRVRARSMAFAQDGTSLVVSYLSHGVVCWNLESLTEAWRIIPIHSHRLIGHAALSPDHQSILLANLSTGMDLYPCGKSAPVARFDIRLEDNNIPVQAIFLHAGEHCACGSPGGDVKIWGSTGGDPKQTLLHDDAVQVLAVRDLSGPIAP